METIELYSVTAIGDVSGWVNDITHVGYAIGSKDRIEKIQWNGVVYGVDVGRLGYAILLDNPPTTQKKKLPGTRNLENVVTVYEAWTVNEEASHEYGLVKNKLGYGIGSRQAVKEHFSTKTDAPVYASPLETVVA